MAIRRFSTADLTGRKGSSMIGGYGWGWSEMDSIATVTVGSGGASSITFSDIPGTYQHLQIRMIGRSTEADTNTDCRLRFNGVSGSSYAAHTLFGTGAVTAVQAFTDSSIMVAGSRVFTTSSQTASVWGGIIADVLDYASTTKNKTMRSFGGWDGNGSGVVSLTSGLFMSTSAVTSIVITTYSGGNWAQHTTAALYGIKAP